MWEPLDHGHLSQDQDKSRQTKDTREHQAGSPSSRPAGRAEAQWSPGSLLGPCLGKSFTCKSSLPSCGTYFLDPLQFFSLFLCYLKKLFVLYWSVGAEQCCDSFGGTAKGLSHTHTHIRSAPRIQALCKTVLRAVQQVLVSYPLKTQLRAGATEDGMVRWHHRLNGHEFEQAPGDTEGQGSIVGCSPWGHKELDTA